MSCDNCATILNYNKYKYNNSNSEILNDKFMNKKIIVYKYEDSCYLKVCCAHTLITGLHIITYKVGNTVYMRRALCDNLYKDPESYFKNYNLFRIDSKIVKLYNIKTYSYVLTNEYTDMRASVHHPLNIKYCNMVTSHENQSIKKDIIISKLNHGLQTYKNKSKKHHKHKDNKIIELQDKIKKLNDMIEDQEYIINKLTQQIL